MMNTPSDNDQSSIGNNKVRFQNVPNSLPVNFSHDKRDNNSRKRCFWHYWEDGEKKLHNKSSDMISFYAPLQWQPLLLDFIELLFNHVHQLSVYINKCITRNKEQDKTTVLHNHHASDNVISADNEEFENSLENIGKTLMMCCLLITLCLFAYTVILKFVLSFLLPFYAALNFSYWFFQWKYKIDNNVFLKDDVIKQLSLCCFSDFLLTVFIYFTFGNSPSIHVELAILHVIPLITFLTLKHFAFLISESPHLTNKSSTQILDGYYFLIIFSIRLFGCRGFTLLPWYARPFVAYLSTYLALLSMDSLISKRTNCLSVTMVPSLNNTLQHNSTTGAKMSSNNIVCSLCNRNFVDNNTGRSPSFSGHSPMQTKIGRSIELEQPSCNIRQNSLTNIRALRRGSLPAGSLMPVKTQTNLNEARGLVAELLSQKDLPPNTVTGLKALIALLNPNQNVPSVYDLLRTLPLVIETPFVGDHLSLSDSLSARRMSPMTFSTVTSATGLPTLEPEPNRPRSSSYWKQKGLEENGESSLPTETESNVKEKLSQKSSVEFTDSLLQTPDGTLFDIDELENSSLFLNLNQWALLIFDLHASSPQTLLSRVAYSAFRQSHLFSIFKIPRQKCFNYFHALEQGYWNIPYHNSIHASDVLHASFYLTMNPVPAAGTAPESRDPRALSSILSSLELLALYTSAAMHDYDHPGKTNAFLVASGDPKAILYNDRSVLENHHAAAAWKLLTLPQNNFIENLDAAEYKRFRYIVMEAILATDLKRHFEILVEFNEKSGRGLEWDNESDKLLVIQVCIKMADINSPTKPFDLHIQWTNRILEEFYAQGDAERDLNLPVSAYMDRSEPQVAKLQDSFVAHLVKPLAQAMHTAGLLPNNNAPDEIRTPETEESEDSSSEDGPLPELIFNLEENHKYWRAQLESTNDVFVENQTNDDNTDDNGIEVNVAADVGNEMETIEEDDETL